MQSVAASVADEELTVGLLHIAKQSTRLAAGDLFSQKSRGQNCRGPGEEVGLPKSIWFAKALSVDLPVVSPLPQRLQRPILPRRPPARLEHHAPVNCI